MALQSGEIIGAYQIENQLGAGGMATVYKAYHERLDRHVAIKMLHPAMLDDPAFHTRFQREAQIVAKLEHPNIVPIYDFSEHNRQPYLVMKFIKGQTLKHVLRARTLTLDEIRKLVMAVGGALEYAHRSGVLHRDIKPSNIIIDEQGTPYLTDFGLARMMQSGESTMSADMMLGTPHYISPEQAQGNKEIDARADVYSFGIVLYELMTGRVPFAADTPYATVHDQIYTPPPPPREINSELTPEVERVLLKALEKDPTDRYASAMALAVDFEAALNLSGLKTLDPDRGTQVMPAAKPAVPPARQSAPITPPRVERPAVTVEDGSASAEINRFQWRPNASWTRDPDGNWGWYTTSELRKLRAAEDAALSPEERLRKRVEKRMEERTGFYSHLGIYILIHVMLWGIWFFTGADGFPWPIFSMFGWGMGVVGHAADYYTRYGGGVDRREEAVQREMERERARLYGDKRKNDDDLGARIRLNEDGELSDSYAEAWADELEQKRKNNK